MEGPPIKNLFSAEWSLATVDANTVCYFLSASRVHRGKSFTGGLLSKLVVKTASHLAKYSDQVDLLKQGGGEVKKGRHWEERMSDEVSRVRPPSLSRAPWSLAPW